MLYPGMKNEIVQRWKWLAVNHWRMVRSDCLESAARMAWHWNAVVMLLMGFTAAANVQASVANLPPFDSVHALHVRTEGDDTTAERGRFDRAWRDLATAFLAATNQDVIFVHGGEWNYPVPSNSAEDDAHAEAPLHFWDKTDVTVRFVAPTRINALNEEGLGTLVSWRNTTNCTWTGDFELYQPGFRDHGTRTNLNATIWFSGRNLDPQIEGDSYARFVGGHHALLLVSVAKFEHYADEAENTEGLTVRKVWFQDIGSTNLIGVGYMDGQCVPPLSRTMVDQCVFTNCIRGVEIHSFFRQVKDVTVQNCYFVDTVEWALGNVNVANVTDVKILNNVFEQIAPPNPAAFQHAISLNGTNQVVRGNTIRGHFEVGMQIVDVLGGWLENNRFEGNGSMRAGVKVYSQASNLSLINNSFRDLTLWALVSDTNVVMTNLMITGNTFLNVSTSGFPALALRGPRTETGFIQGNHFLDDRFPSLSRGIDIAASSNLVVGANEYCGPDPKLNVIHGDDLTLLPDFGFSPPTIELTILPGVSNLVVPVALFLSAELTSVYGVRSVQFLVDGIEVASLDTPPFEYYWRTVPAGNHQVTCRATDACGQTSDSEPQLIVVETNVISTAASFVSRDTTTSGQWPKRFGGDGYVIPGYVSYVPPYAAWVSNSAEPLIFGEFVENPVGPQRLDSGYNISSFWVGRPQQTIDLDFLDAREHLISLYFWDPDGPLRQQRIDVLDRTTGELLDSQHLANFTDGVYLSWRVQGSVRIVSTATRSDSNGVCSGVFFDSPWEFDDWVKIHFGRDAVSAPETDPDGDGLSNLLEYALGLPPLRSDTFPLSSLVMGPSGLELIYSVSLMCDAELFVESSRDLIHWSSTELEILESNTVGLTKTVKVRLSDSPTPQQQGYVRLRAVLP